MATDSTGSKEPTKHLFDYQKKLVADMLQDPNKHICFMECGLGKGPSSVMWGWAKCKQTRKNKLLVVTTASKTKVKDELKRNDFEQDADSFGGDAFHKTVTEFETVSWDLLYKWVDAHKSQLDQWVYIIDECFKGKNPTAKRSKAFLKITKATNDWTGYTATPGQVWIDFLGYFIAAGLVRNKTAFMREFCNVQTFKGFPEVVGYYNEDTLKQWWAQISIAPDASKALQELPESNYDLTYVSKPKGYSKVLKMRRRLCENGEVSEGEDYDDLIDNPSKLTNYLRRLCWTEKKQWVADYLEGLGEPCLIFYNYIDTGNDIEDIAYKVLPKGAKVWRIDGSHHEIPTRDTIGKYDIVLSQWQSGSEGLNLEFITEWLAVEPTYSYVIHHQGKKRVMRIGQTKPVFYHMLISKGTIEEDILKCIREKKEFSDRNWLISQKLIKKEEK